MGDIYYKMFSIVNKTKIKIEITCIYNDDRLLLDRLLINNFIDFLRVKEFLLSISYKNENKSVIVLMENTKCDIYANESDRLCFIVQ